MTVPLKLAIILVHPAGSLGLVDSYLGLVLVYVAMGIPSAVFIMTGSCAPAARTEESARMDGASEFRIMRFDHAAGAAGAGDRGNPECSADLERLLLPTGSDHFRRPQDAPARSSPFSSASSPPTGACCLPA
jgi:hypothetical protein